MAAKGQRRDDQAGGHSDPGQSRGKAQIVPSPYMDHRKGSQGKGSQSDGQWGAVRQQWAATPKGGRGGGWNPAAGCGCGKGKGFKGEDQWHSWNMKIGRAHV